MRDHSRACDGHAEQRGVVGGARGRRQPRGSVTRVSGETTPRDALDPILEAIRRSIEWDWANSGGVSVAKRVATGRCSGTPGPKLRRSKPRAPTCACRAVRALRGVGIASERVGKRDDDDPALGASTPRIMIFTTASFVLRGPRRHGGVVSVAAPRARRRGMLAAGLRSRSYRTPQRWEAASRCTPPRSSFARPRDGGGRKLAVGVATELQHLSPSSSAAPRYERPARPRPIARARLIPRRLARRRPDRSSWHRPQAGAPAHPWPQRRLVGIAPILSPDRRTSSTSSGYARLWRVMADPRRSSRSS